MIINYLALAIALMLSAVAAYYSIVGLAVIFASALVPVIIMASTLEAGKVVATSWLYRNWHTAPRIIKYYLAVAVVILMFITSMGIFGFLSKAHLEQAVIGGESISRLSVYDEKIKIAKENIDANRKALKQMDEAVDQIMGRSQDEKGADKAVAVRRSQAKERQRLQSEIQAEQKTISQLNEERAPFAAEVRKVEAEVGPIKYIAALAYGDNPDQNVMEKAVRWVIIILVFVFDPLAIMLLLAANHSLYGSKKQEQPTTTVEDQPQQDDGIPPLSHWFKFLKKSPPIEAVQPPPVVEVPVVEQPSEVETPLPPEPVQESEQSKERWSPRWYQRAKGLMDRKKEGIIEISKDSITEIK